MEEREFLNENENDHHDVPVPNQILKKDGSMDSYPESYLHHRRYGSTVQEENQRQHRDEVIESSCD